MNGRSRKHGQAGRFQGSSFAVFALLAFVAVILCGCGTAARRGPSAERETKPSSIPAPATGDARAPHAGGYYLDDGPGDHPPANLEAVPDAQPRAEPLHRFANNAYSVLGQEYVPFKELKPFRQRGLASWYGRRYHGQQTSSGEPYDMYAMTAAHPTLPVPSYARVTNLANGRSAIVRINDRGPFRSNRIIDLSYTAAYKLGFAASGSAQVEVNAILPADMAALDSRRPIAANPEGQAQNAREQLAEARPAVPAPAVDVRPLDPPRDAGAMPLAADAAGVWLQLGAFSARENAENFRVRLYQSLAWLNQAIDILQKDGLFRLHLGPYRDRAEASGIAERIRETLDLTPVFVVR